jgi:hypothetical protein
MRVQQWLMVAALVVTPALAAAQGATTTTTTTSGQTTTTADFDVDSDPGGWFASAFVGSDFAQDADGSSTDFGGSLGYTNGWIGGEFMAGFTPNFQLRNNILAGEEPQVNSYMMNLMVSVPVGDDFRFQPFVSGGLGAMTLRADLLSGDDDAIEETAQPSDTQWGSNIGFGLMGFAGNIGVRGDIRYFRAFTDSELRDAIGTTDSNTSASSQIANQVLSGLDFWRAHIGVAFRW